MKCKFIVLISLNCKITKNIKTLFKENQNYQHFLPNKLFYSNASKLKSDVTTLKSLKILIEFVFKQALTIHSVCLIINS